VFAHPGGSVRLVACPKCHLQYDVTRSTQARFRCSCGETVQVVVHGAVDAPIHRCAACGAALPANAERCEYCKSPVERDVSRLSLICPECFSRNADDARYCVSCGVEFKPLEVPGEGAELSCPVCAIPLKVRPIGGLPVFECGGCHGLWVPEDRFDQLVQKAIEAQKSLPSNGLAMAGHTKAYAIEGDVHYRQCPVCHTPMYRKNFGRRSGVIVDWCGEHGTWLDADELEHIARFIMAGGLKKASAGASGVDGEHQRYTQDQMEALLLAEKRLAEERLRQVHRRSHMQSGGFHIGSLGDLLEFFLG
jgi:Zn-finger nucleic acid-binding protein